MKTLMIIPLILTASTCKTVNKESKASTLPFESVMFSPFYSNKESTIVVKTKSSFFKFWIYITNDKNSNVCIVNDEITTPGTYVYKYDNSYTRINNTVYLSYSTGIFTIKSPAIERNIVRSKVEYITDNQNIQTDSSVAILNGDFSFILTPITYYFSGFEGLYVPSYFHKIDLNDFVISFPYQYHPLFDCKASIVINNYNNVFKDITGAGEYVVFNLKPVENGQTYTFEVADDLYVHPERLTMSSTMKNGYVKTKHIYLPRNEMQNQDKYDCYFKFEEFGIDKDMLFHQFKVSALKNIVGYCNNAEYCIVREQS